LAIEVQASEAAMSNDKASHQPTPAAVEAATQAPLPTDPVALKTNSPVAGSVRRECGKPGCICHLRGPLPEPGTKDADGKVIRPTWESIRANHPTMGR
jgi:hypothetical protein